MFLIPLCLQQSLDQLVIPAHVSLLLTKGEEKGNSAREFEKRVADRRVDTAIPHPTLIPGSARGSNLDCCTSELHLQPRDNALENSFMR